MEGTMKDSLSDSIVLSWRNITIWTKKNQKSEGRKKLLSDVSGIAKSGDLTAMLSPSGAGKTTLLATLSKRYKGAVCGEVFVNGCELSAENMSVISGFVCQKEQNYQDLTVYEQLIFMARLKMDRNTTQKICHENVLKVTQSLLLSHKLHVTISSLSGGQRKRLTLAVQLLTEPKILFCDEPTTGLDSYSAQQVVKLLRAIANEGKIVLCSIHQPASGIFELFDNVTLLASGGQLAYHGPVSSINSFLFGLGASCPKNFNMSEFIVSQVTCKNLTDRPEDEKAEVQRIVDYFSQSEEFENLMVDIKNETNKTTTLDLYIKTRKRESVPFVTELRWLFWRTFLLAKHSYKRILLNFYINAIVIFFIGLIFNGSFSLDHKGIQSTIGFFFIYTRQIFYPVSYLTMHEFSKDVPVCVLEVADRVYSPISFYLSKSAFLTANMAVQTVIFMLLCFWGSGIEEAVFDFIMISALSVLLSAVSCSFGIFVSTAFQSLETAALFSVPFEVINRVFGGLLIRIDSLPWFLYVFKYVSFHYYSFEAINILKWAKVDYISCDWNSDLPCYQSGDEILSSLGFKRDNLLVDVTALIVYAFVCHLLAYGFLIRKLNLLAAY